MEMSVREIPMFCSANRIYLAISNQQSNASLSRITDCFGIEYNF